MTSPHGEALDALSVLWRRTQEALGPLRSLAPGRTEPTPLPELAEGFLDVHVGAEVSLAFAGALSAVVEAQIENFPRNLFWDFDYAASCLMEEARRDDGFEHIRTAASRIVRLEEVFGTRSRVQFRYVHDFMYGFDWARWVRADPSRAVVGPFDEAFVLHMAERGLEILGLISRNDARYPALPPGVSRNPFGFSREPADEERLHRDLAERGLVPVEAWRVDARPRWDQPFGELRAERARALGLWRAAELP